jgi:hypothetical protein
MHALYAKLDFGARLQMPQHFGNIKIGQLKYGSSQSIFTHAGSTNNQIRFSSYKKKMVCHSIFKVLALV